MLYAIGDIHGRYDLLKKLYDAIIEDIKQVDDPFDNVIYFLGDYIDRGKQNIRVLDFLMNLRDVPELKLTHVFLWGNHEQIFMNAMMNPRHEFFKKMWLNNGGQAFLNEAKYDFDYFVNAFPWHHYVNWFKTHCDFYVETPDYVFVHGALDIRKPMITQDREYMLWGRHTQKDWYKTYPKMVIHGHTPVDNLNMVIDNNRINLDTTWIRTKDDRLVMVAAALPVVRADGPPRLIEVYE